MLRELEENSSCTGSLVTFYYLRSKITINLVRYAEQKNVCEINKLIAMSMNNFC